MRNVTGAPVAGDDLYGRRVVMRQRIYNPAQLKPEELKASFIARHETLARMLRLLAEQKPGHPCQHVVLVGPRGMGKTTLGLSFLQAVREDANLATKWQPVPFPEESYEIGDLADFWLAALRHLAQATGEERWRDRADGLQEDERDTERLATYALAALLDFCEEQGKRLILFVENLDLVFSQLGNEREVHALREALIEHAEILLVGSANTVFDAIRSYAEPFYEFFRKITLRGLERHESRQLLETMADRDHGNRRSVPLDLEEGRLETIRRLTGGNPRLLVLACRMLLESPLGSAIEDMERLIDEQTPYFKARIEALPPQARRVFHCLAKAWAPSLTREVAADAKLSSSHASAQLRQLIGKGYVREVRLAGETRGRYEVSDRFYNIYYLLRFSRSGRARLERLVDFLHQLFRPVGMRHTYEAALDALRNGTFSTADMSDWLTERLDFTQLAMHKVEDAPAHLGAVADRSQPDELPQQRHYHAAALIGAAFASAESGRPEDATALLGWTHMLIAMIAYGGAAQVKHLLVEANATESFEPLWLAARAELGEDPGPLPAEVLDAVDEVRRMVAEERT